jgi:hypothetical protein
VVSAEQIVLATQGQRSDGILHKVVVYAEAAVAHITSQTRQQGEGVFYSFAYAAVLGGLASHLIHPFLELQYDRICLLLPLLLQGVTSNFESTFFGKGKSTDFRKVKSTP